MFQADDLQGIALAGYAARVGDEFRHEEQADALGALGSAGQAGQHEVAGVGRKVVVGPCDVDFLAGDGIGAVGVGFGLGAQRPDIGPSLGFGQVHGAVPGPRNQVGDIKGLDRVGCVVFQRLDLALGHQGVQLQRQAGRAHHVIDTGRQGHRQAKAAMVGVGRHADPAACGDGGKAVGKAGRGAHDAVFKPGGVFVAHAVQGGEGGFAQFGCLGQNGLDQVGGGFGKAGGGGDVGKVQDMGQQEVEIGKGGAVGHGAFLLWGRFGVGWLWVPGLAKSGAQRIGAVSIRRYPRDLYGQQRRCVTP